MKTINFNYEIIENDLENGKLKDDIKLNTEVNFMKQLMDLVKNGEDITIEKLLFQIAEIETYNDVEVINPETKEKKILKDTIKKNCYNCSAIINNHIFVSGIKKEFDIETPVTFKDKTKTKTKGIDNNV